MSDNINEQVSELAKLVKVQCSDGNWNHDEYMFGMANGMILALSLFTGRDPKYLDAPDAWGCDNTDKRESVFEIA